MKWWIAILVLVLGACSAERQTATPIPTSIPTPIPTPPVPLIGTPTQVFTSPMGHFTAQLWRHDQFGGTSYISGFDITDVQTGVVHRQALSDVFERLHSSYDGYSFQWTPSDNYIVVLADSMVSSHGCSEMLVYAGDGSALVRKLDMSACAGIMADWSVRVLDVCANDDIIFAIQYSPVSRLSPATGEVVENEGDGC